MDTQFQETTKPVGSSIETQVPKETQKLEMCSSSPITSGNDQKEEGAKDLKYSKPWKYEKWFIGGYTQSRMLNFKKPKSMYTVINLFAGELFR